MRTALVVGVETISPFMDWSDRNVAVLSLPTLEYTDDGGLLAYGPSLDELAGRAVSFVDRILKGAKPGNLAIEQAEWARLGKPREAQAADEFGLDPQLGRDMGNRPS